MILDIIQILLIVTIIVMLLAKNKTMRKVSSETVILDSCALIDGRIIDLVKSGFMPATLIVPQFIIEELQLLADGSDAQKRERARFGLDTVTALQQLENASVLIDPEEFKDVKTTDDKLIHLAQKKQARLYTTDFNLNKVASIKGVTVLNVQELASILRTTVLPGEERTIKITQKGSNHDQGVGYLEDGTMVVINNGSRLIGKTVPVQIERMHQTLAGKMLFANYKGDQPQAKPTQRRRTRSKAN